MAEKRVQRRLAAILAADVVGYSRLMEADEEGTRVRLRSLYAELIDPRIAADGGRIVKTSGDGILVEFPSAVNAVRNALAIQKAIAARDANLPEERRIQFRVGINVGDVIVEGDDIHGDGVNVAARLEGLCEPGEVYVSGTVYDQAAGKLPASFEDLGGQSVKNISRPVRVYRTRAHSIDVTNTPETIELFSLPDKPSIAVLPFDNMSADPEQEYFSDGITEDIITELSKISGLFVIARHSAFTYKGKSVTLKQVGRELGVRFALEGSVRKAGDRLRITAQLIDAVSDEHMWAERYDRNLEDIFAVQEEVSRKVAEALEVALMPDESKRLAQPPTDNLEAYDAYLRARRTPYPPTRHNIRSARAMYEQVIEMDPTFAGGYAGKSMMHSLVVIHRHSDEPANDAAISMELAKRAVELDQDFSRSYSALSQAHTVLGQHEEAVAAAKHAVEIQPGDADSHAFYSRCLRLAGLGNEAIEEVQIALRLDPQFVEGPYLNMLAAASFVSGRYEDTVAAYERNSSRGGPVAIHNMLNWAAACGFTGRLEKAEELIREILQERPDLTLANVQVVHGQFGDAELERLRDGLRKAGWED